MKLTYLAHVVEIVAIAYLLLHVFVLAPVQPSSNSFKSQSEVSEPAALSRAINSSQAVIDDLMSLGCRLVGSVNETLSKFDSGVTINNYSDFRMMAYNTKLVFYRDARTEVPPGILFITLYEGFPFFFAYFESGNQTDGGSFTRFEKLEFTSAYADYDSVNKNYLVHLAIRNTGSASATIDNSTIFYNGKPYSASTYVGYVPNAPLGTTGLVTLDPGNSTTLIITLPDGAGSPWVSSMTIKVMIQTTAGRQYPKVITLP